MHQLRTQRLVRGENPPENQTDEIVGQDHTHDLPAAQIPHSALGPANFPLERLPVQRTGAQQRGNGTPSYIIAGEAEEIQQHRQTDSDGGRAKPIPRQRPRSID